LMVWKRRAVRNGQVGGFDDQSTRALSIEPLLGLKLWVRAGGRGIARCRAGLMVR